jgi:hypothetical protein
MLFSPKRYCIFLDDTNRERAAELELAHSTSFSGLMRRLIQDEHDRLLAIASELQSKRWK